MRSSIPYDGFSLSQFTNFGNIKNAPSPLLAHQSVQQHRNMNRLSACAILDLTPAGSAVSGNKRIRWSRANGRKEAGIGHFHRHIMGIGTITKGAGHPAA